MTLVAGNVTLHSLAGDSWETVADCMKTITQSIQPFPAKHVAAMASASGVIRK